jgi:hypothetical protein
LFEVSHQASPDCPFDKRDINPSNANINYICHLLALLGAHHILHVSRIRVKTQYGEFVE